MAYLLRLVVLFCMFCGGANAAIPQITQYGTGVNGPWFDSMAAACSSKGGKATVINGRCMRNSSEFDSVEYTLFTRPGQCPADSTPVPGKTTCSCSAGYVEQGNQCVKKKSEICGPLQGMGTGVSSMDSDFGTQSAKWAASKLGQSANSCMGGCQVSGKVTSCVVGTGNSSSTVCYLSGTSFTGDTCTNSTDGGSGGTGEPNSGDKDKPTDCPVGYEPSKYAPGVCIPKPNDCPSGSSPSKYAEGICIPDEKGDDGSCEDPKDPTKRAECEGKKNQCPSGQVQSTTQVNTCVPAKDGSDKGKDGSKVDCKGGKCTVTKDDGSKEEKGQDEVCKEQPDLAMCKESKGQFSGSCTASFQCDGDVLQCAALQEQHKRNCSVFDTENDMSRLFDSDAKKPQENVLTANGTEIDLKGHITVDSIIGNGQCPADVPFQVFGKTVVFKLSEFCRYFNAMGMLLFLSTCATCLRILGT